MKKGIIPGLTFVAALALAAAPAFAGERSGRTPEGVNRHGRCLPAWNGAPPRRRPSFPDAGGKREGGRPPGSGPPHGEHDLPRRQDHAGGRRKHLLGHQLGCSIRATRSRAWTPGTIGFNGSNYAKTSDEYTGDQRPGTGATTTHLGHLIDTSAAPGGGSTSAILAEVCKRFRARTPRATATTPYTRTCRAATPGTAPGTAPEPAPASRSSSRSSGSWTETRAAIRRST